MVAITQKGEQGHIIRVTHPDDDKEDDDDDDDEGNSVFHVDHLFQSFPMC